MVGEKILFAWLILMVIQIILEVVETIVKNNKGYEERDPSKKRVKEPCWREVLEIGQIRCGLRSQR